MWADVRIFVLFHWSWSTNANLSLLEGWPKQLFKTTQPPQKEYPVNFGDDRDSNDHREPVVWYCAELSMKVNAITINKMLYKIFNFVHDLADVNIPLTWQCKTDLKHPNERECNRTKLVCKNKYTIKVCF